MSAEHRGYSPHVDTSGEHISISEHVMTDAENTVPLYGELGEVVKRDPAGMLDLLGELKADVEILDVKLQGNPQSSQIRKQFDEARTRSFLRASHLEFNLRSKQDREEYTRIYQGVYEVVAGKSSQEITIMKERLQYKLLPIPSEPPEA